MNRRIPESQHSYKIIKRKRHYLKRLKIIKKRILVLISLLAIGICIGLFCFYRYNTNQVLLEQIHKSMIGKTFGDNRELTFRVGTDVERTEVYISDQNYLIYKSGVYSTSLDRTPPKNTLIFSANTIYTEKNVSNPVTYSYDLTINLFGKVTIVFYGRSYPVDIDDTKESVTGITFYSQKTIG